MEASQNECERQAIRTPKNKTATLVFQIRIEQITVAKQATKEGEGWQSGGESAKIDFWKFLKIEFWK